MQHWRSRVTNILPWATCIIVAVQLLSLRLGILDRFFFDSMHAAQSVQGLDYFSLPKAFLSLITHHSAYDSFGHPVYVDRLTWYLAHPALAVVFGSWLSRFDPQTSYGVFAILSLAIMCICAWLLASLSTDALVRRIIWLLILGAFPTYWVYYTGNVQALLVMALAMTFGSLYQLAYAKQTLSAKANWMLFGGLLLSLLTKPIVLLMLPLLLLLPETRRSALRALSVYVIVSLLFEVIPALNPEANGLLHVAWLFVHPAYVQAHMNIYANNFIVTAEMKDNSIHWLNLVAQSGYRMQHIDIFSLPIFLDALLRTRTPGWLYQIPLLLIAVLTAGVYRVENTCLRLRAALMLLMAVSLSFFLTYPTVWEYQYTSVLPVASILLLMLAKGPDEAGLWSAWTLRGMLMLAACAWLPSLYFLMEGRAVDNNVLTWIRLDRVVPVTVLFFWMVWALARVTLFRRPVNHAGYLSKQA